MDEEILNSVDAEQEQVVDAPIPATDDGATAVTEPAGESIQQQEPAKPAQTAEENSRWAELRRESEIAKQEAANLRAEQSRLQKALTAYGYEGTPQEIADALEAQRQSITVEELQANRQAEEQQFKSMLLESPEYQEQARKAQELQEIINKQTFEKDLAQIKSFNPKESAKSIDDLGETFIRARAMGIDNVTAYELAKAEQQRKNPVPPSMGDINASGADESDFYTMEQLKSMTAEDVHKNWAKVQKSRERLFKGV